MLFFVQKVTTVATTGLAHQNVSGHNSCGMKLNCLHVGQWDHAGVLRNGHTRPFIDDGISGLSIDPAETSGCNNSGPSQIGPQPSCTQIKNHCPVATLAVVYQGNSL